MSEKRISRHKYERAKEAVTAWHEKYEEVKEKLDDIETNRNSLASQNKKLTNTVGVCKEEISKLKTEVNRWKKLSEELPDSELVEELESENKQHRREIRKLKKELHDMDDRYKDKIAKLEREKLLSDGKIQQLEEARKDMKERYNDLKQDYRESQRWNRGTISRTE